MITLHCKTEKSISSRDRFRFACLSASEIGCINTENPEKLPDFIKMETGVESDNLNFVSLGKEIDLLCKRLSVQLFK